MSEPDRPSARQIPLSWRIALSVLVTVHLFAVVCNVLSAPSGPWPTPYGSDMALGPHFASLTSQYTSNYYLNPIGMSHNYHFISNRVAVPQVYFEVKLKDQDGKVFKTVRFPDDKSSVLGFWIEHRKSMLASNLADDQPIQSAGPEKVASDISKSPDIHVWLQPSEIQSMVAEGVLPPSLLQPEASDDPAKLLLPPMLMDPTKKVDAPNQKLRLVTIREVQRGILPRNRPLESPSDWSLILAKSYTRYLCRKYDAESGEIIRYSQAPIMPVLMFVRTPPQDAFIRTEANFGEFPKS